MSVTMALVDYIPVVLFLISTGILLECLQNKMGTACFTVYAGGVVMCFLAGVFKATWKLLYASGTGDFQRLNSCFFPMQSTAFVLMAIALLIMLIGGGRAKGRMYAAAAAPGALKIIEGTWLFIAMLCGGIIAITAVLCALAKKLGKSKVCVFFMAACVGLLAMGYLSTRNFELAFLNWLAEIINILAQGSLLVGVLKLRKAGLKEMSLIVAPGGAAQSVPAEKPAPEVPIPAAMPGGHVIPGSPAPVPKSDTDDVCAEGIPVEE